jgi:hypothetical protein
MAWLHRFFAFFTSKHDMASELPAHLDSSNPVFSENRARVLADGRPLLVAAQEAHEVRDDLAREQICDMIIAIASIHCDPSYVELDSVGDLGVSRCGSMVKGHARVVPLTDATVEVPVVPLPAFR